MIHKSGNHAFKEPPFKDGDVVEGGNYMQLAPGTEICVSVKHLTITSGNFGNCKPQPGWVVKGGNWSQVSRCSHEHPEWIDRGLPECPADCDHRSKTEVVRELSEGEVRHRTLKGLELSELSSEKVTDKDGIAVLRHTVREFVYADKVVTNG